MSTTDDQRAPAAPPALLLEGVGKRYLKLDEQAMLLKSLLPFTRPKRSELWALRDLDLRVEPGETIGVLGRNGAGKTTLLRMLAGVTRPSTGRLTVNGRVAPLIGVGVGFHPEMSGRENVYVNGMLLGLTKAEVDERFAAIVAFAELEEFIDTPVKFYSSGMFMRLGFAVAVHVEPQILLVDEILAVGDIAFQRKCADRMRALKDTGTTVLLVSHSMHAIRLLCPRALLIRRGVLEADGESEEVIGLHYQLMTAERDDANEHGVVVTILEQAILGPDGEEVHATEQDVDLVCRMRLRFETDVDSPHVYFRILTDDGQVAYSMQTDIGRAHRSYRAGEEAAIEVRFKPRLGGGGTFRPSVVITNKEGRDVLLLDSASPSFYVSPRLGVMGLSDLDAVIQVDGQLLSDHSSLLLSGAADGAAATKRAARKPRKRVATPKRP